MTASIVLDDKERRIKDTSASSESYEYVALPARGWTKFLEFHSGSGSLACSLRCVSVEDVILGFEALSSCGAAIRFRMRSILSAMVGNYP